MTSSPQDPGEKDSSTTPSGGSGEEAGDERDPPPTHKPIPVRPRDGGEGRSTPPRPTTPKPVRAGLEDAEGQEVAAAEVVAGDEEASLEMAGESLTVRVRGRALGHTSQGSAHLLLLGFHRPGEDEPARETLVPGTSLEALSHEQLETAWHRGRPPRDPFEPTELFPGTSRNRGRGRGR